MSDEVSHSLSHRLHHASDEHLGTVTLFYTDEANLYSCDICHSRAREDVRFNPDSEIFEDASVFRAGGRNETAAALRHSDKPAAQLSDYALAHISDLVF